MIEIWTDGSCDHHDVLRPGGWCFLIVDAENDVSFGDSDGCLRTTNNQMELNAILEALYALKLVQDSAIREVVIYPDSEWSIKCITKEYDCTRKQKKTGKQGGHVEWLKNIWNLMKGYNNIKFIRVSGHSGNENNEKVHKQAEKMMNWARDNLR